MGLLSLFAVIFARFAPSFAVVLPLDSGEPAQFKDGWGSVMVRKPGGKAEQ